MVAIVGVPVLSVELGVPLSLIVLGLVVGVRTPPAAAVAMVGCFGSVHGYVHG